LMAAQYKGPDAKGQKKADVKFIDVPEDYANPETSGIKTTINKGANTYDIVIKGTARPKRKPGPQG
jgi:hypothetical protein